MRLALPVRLRRSRTSRHLFAHPVPCRGAHTRKPGYALANKAIGQTGQDAQGEFQQEMQKTFTGVAGKVAEVLSSYAKEHGYTVVLDGGNQQVPVVLYATQSADITKAVVDAYNVKSGVPAPPTQPAAAAPAAPTPKSSAPAKAPAVH